MKMLLKSRLKTKTKEEVKNKVDLLNDKKACKVGGNRVQENYQITKEGN